MRSCIIVLIGKSTSSHKWVRYEIEKVYELDEGIVGIFVHNLKDQHKNQTEKGVNSFYTVYANNENLLSKYVTCFDSKYCSSINVYNDIKENIEKLMESAINTKDPR